MAEGIPDYDELRLRIEPREAGTYSVVAEGPGHKSDSEVFVSPFSDHTLEKFILKMGAGRRGVRGYRSPQMEAAKDFGSELCAAVLKGKVRDVYVSVRERAYAANRGLRVRLSLTNVPELMAIPWEFLYEERSFLSQSIYSPVVRSLDLPQPMPPQRITWPLRILGLVSSPRGYQKLDVKGEKAMLEEALSPLTSRGLVELNWAQSGTLQELARVLAAPRDEHVLHYIGHGIYDERAETAILVFEDTQGEEHPVTGADVGMILQGKFSLRLAVLNSCEGARGDRVDPFSGVAASLLGVGIPAVIGMQFEITDEAAKVFSERLYTSLVQGYPVDAALAQARKAIFAAGNEVEFGTPVLFLRAADTRLFDVQHIWPPEEKNKGDFSVLIEQRPKVETDEGGPGWQLAIENTGGCALADVLALWADGERLDDPVELGVGERHVIRWSDEGRRGGRKLITVSATDVHGSRISEQVADGVNPPPPPPRRGPGALRLLGEGAAIAGAVGALAAALTDAATGTGLSDLARVLTRVAIWTPVAVAIAVWMSLRRGDRAVITPNGLRGIGAVMLAALLSGAIFVFPDQLAESVRVVLALAAIGAGLGALVGSLWTPSSVTVGVIAGTVAGVLLGLIVPIGELPRVVAIGVRSGAIIGLTLTALLLSSESMRRALPAGVK